MNNRATSGWLGTAYRLRASFPIDKSAPFSNAIGARRYYPVVGGGISNLPRYLWNMKHLHKITDGKYTERPLQVHRLGGRHPDTGRKINQHIGGGVRFDYFMIDFNRRGPNDAPNKFYEERVLEVRRDPNRSAHIALVAGSRGKRWIIASENMTAGQIIGTSEYIGENPIVGIEGYAHPLGALSIGTFVHCIEKYPGTGGSFIVEAGAAAEIIRPHGEYVVLRMPFKHEFAFHRTCVATIGRVSNAQMHQDIWGSAQMHRRFGYMMSSGLFHKKDGYSGRKIRPGTVFRTLAEPPRPPPKKYSITLTMDQCNGQFGTAQMHNLYQGAYNGRIYPLDS